MKGLISKALIVGIFSLFVVNAANANMYNKNNMNMNSSKNMNMNSNMNMKNMNMKKWTCETNASAAMTDADKMADEKMAKMMMSAKMAFEYAMKHCRDCSKITCTMNG